MLNSFHIFCMQRIAGDLHYSSERTKGKAMKPKVSILLLIAIVNAACASRPDLKISAQWGGTNVGDTIYGPKQTAFIAVTNIGKADCVPPPGQEFVIGVYFKTLGLIKATSVGPFPTSIAPGQTVNFVAQGVDQLMFTPPYQNVVYNGYVDFYVASRAPTGPELSAAIASACANPELSIENNNAHSVSKIITNP